MNKPDIWLVIPPMTQLNTMYPSAAFLSGYLRAEGLRAEVSDLAPRFLTEKVLAPEGLDRMAPLVQDAWFRRHFETIRDRVPAAVALLQSRDGTSAHRIAADPEKYFPPGPRMERVFGELDREAAFGAAGSGDFARFVATLFIEDLVDVITREVDPRFELARYGEKLAASAATLDPLVSALESPHPTLIDLLFDEWIHEWVGTVPGWAGTPPRWVGISLPFPGNVYAGLRLARVIKRDWGDRCEVVVGGGYVNTELRELEDPRFFDYVDALVFDDGEVPLVRLLQATASGGGAIGAWRGSGGGSRSLVRTWWRRPGRGGEIVRAARVPATRAGDQATRIEPAATPDYSSFRGPTAHLSMLDALNPMHRIWSDGRWAKLMLAHGCYWKKCAFCDTSLDYIGRYAPVEAGRVADQMDAIAADSGGSTRGFHFVDEAAPPALLKSLARELARRGRTSYSWWGNVRFDRAFTPEVCEELARAGCVAVTGGLEVASDRLLKLMNKGVTVEQVARVTHAMSEAGILVHAYLMYGFPTQTVAETLDALERVRQLFAAGCIHSAYWHRFSATAHSDIGLHPEKYGIRIVEHRPDAGVRFARNDLPFVDSTELEGGWDHDRLGACLNRALYNYMRGVGLDLDVRQWFDARVPKARVAKNLVRGALKIG